jgi:uncharacterized protein YdeI (YjbR/CyaY-like superfamily)
MTRTGTNPEVDFFFTKATNWQKEFEKLRKIILTCGLTETLKWGQPCYTVTNGSAGQPSRESNVVLIHGFKEYCAMLFFKGALMSDSNGILVQQTKNVQAARQIRFTNTKEIVKLAPVLKSYIYEAIEVEKAGLQVDLKKTRAFPVAEEFKKQLDANKALKTAFGKLTPGRQRAYLLHFSAPKQSKTRESRVEKSIPQILDGKGLND